MSDDPAFTVVFHNLKHFLFFHIKYIIDLSIFMEKLIKSIPFVSYAFGRGFYKVNMKYRKYQMQTNINTCRITLEKASEILDSAKNSVSN